MPQDAIAHVKKTADGNWDIQRLVDHLYGVAKLASEFAEPFGNADWGYSAGLWHDLGKYSKDFQNYIKNASGYCPDAHLEGKQGRVDHSTAGAIHALKQFNAGKVLAYLIAGHHAGLADWKNADEGRAQLSHRVEKEELLKNVLAEEPPASILQHPTPSTKPPSGASPALWIRLLFSCLVDADFLDTEEFMDSANRRLRSRYPDLAVLNQQLDCHLEQVCRWAPDTRVNGLRAQILHWCRQAAESEPGVFSLTVPTGGGKTLSSMAFAIKHALKHNKRRIIYVIPYTSIIEQTADVLRKIFGDCVIEHHSNLDPENETVKSRLACENWDAPIIVTTNVQFFESLFAAKTSRVRKLHRLVNSVVILDEAQLIPPEFLGPILRLVDELSNCYGMSFVLSTATQPALRAEDLNGGCTGLTNVKEIVPDPIALHRDLKRINIHIPSDLNKRTDPESLAHKLIEHSQVLCIVNTRDECRMLHSFMPEETFHLSGYMCGAHRSSVIKEIKDRLERGQPVRLVSTQLVEAGVDLDFPVVYRALSGLDSIAQAGGRCNREGKLTDGNLIVFVPWKDPPRGHLSHMESACREVLRCQSDDVLSPENFIRYFKHLYWMRGTELDKYSIIKSLAADAQLSIRFREASQNFKMIDESIQKSIFVRYSNGPELINLLKTNGPDRWVLRKMQRFSISISKYIFDKLFEAGDIVEVHEGYFAQAYEHLYDIRTGFLGNQLEQIDAKALII